DRSAGEKARRELAFVRVLDSGVELGEEGQREEPGERSTGRAETVSAEHPRVDHRLVEPGPGVRVRRVDPPELGQEVAGFERQAPRQARRPREGLLELDAVRREDHVALAGEIGIDRAEERELALLEREAAPVRIVRAPFERLELV